MEGITSINNQLIKDLKKQKRENRFLLFLDNPKLVEEAFLSGYKPEKIFVEFGKNFDFLSTMQGTMQSTMQIVVPASNQVIKALADVIEPQGILGVFELKKEKLSVPKTNFFVLDELQDPGNVGTILRTAIGTGFESVFLIDSVSITNDKLVRSSMGAIFKLKIFETNKSDFIAFAKENELSLLKAEMSGQNIFEFKTAKNVGVVLGNEGSGVSSEISKICQKSISIPMDSRLESYNVAVAGGIIASVIAYKNNK